MTSLKTGLSSIPATGVKWQASKRDCLPFLPLGSSDKLQNGTVFLSCLQGQVTSLKTGLSSFPATGVKWQASKWDFLPFLPPGSSDKLQNGTVFLSCHQGQVTRFKTGLSSFPATKVKWQALKQFCLSLLLNNNLQNVFVFSFSPPRSNYKRQNGSVWLSFSSTGVKFPNGHAFLSWE